MSDGELIEAMFYPDSGIARIAKRIYDGRHVADPAPDEPAHCAECFEGCAKCQ